MGQLVGARVERGVAELDIAIQQRDGIGRAAHLVFEQVVDARGLRRRSGLCGGEVVQLGAFVGGQQRQLRDACLRVGGHAGK